MTKSKIEWTDRTWNPTVGCARVSPGCENCYAEKQAARVVLMSAAQGRESVYLPVVDVGRRRWNRTCVTVPERLEDPLRWKKPAMVFVNSMSDLFHDDVPFEFIAAVFGVAAACPQHTFQILTKRPQRMREFFAWASSAENMREVIDELTVTGGAPIGLQDRGLPLAWPLPNVWLGVSVEDQQRADERIPVLLECPAAVRFLSCEPLLGEVDIAKWLDPWTCSACNYHGAEANSGPCRCADCGVATVYSKSLGSEQCPGCGKDDGTSDAVGDTCPDCGSVDGWSRDHGFMFDSDSRIGWVIVGGESGPGARECDVAWVRWIVDQCAAADVPCFVKQLGADPVLTQPAQVGHGSTGQYEIETDGHVESLDLKSRKGADPSEWPADLRVQEMPRR